MNKPIDLVVANVMHEAIELDNQVAKLETAAVRSGLKISKKERDAINANVAESVARQLLCQSAHDCPISTVYAALKAIKAPATTTDILDGLQAVRDRQ